MVWVAVPAVAVLVAVLVAAAELVAGRSLEATAFAAITRSIGATAAALILVCLLWIASEARTRSASGQNHLPRGRG